MLHEILLYCRCYLEIGQGQNGPIFELISTVNGHFNGPIFGKAKHHFNVPDASITHWVKNPLRRTSEHNHKYNYLNF